jgi:hypothetical protein
MRGAWLTDVARCLLHHDTFEHIASPAIADLQHEADAAGALLARGYAGVLLALAGALCHDIRCDLRVLADDASELLRLIAIQVSYYVCMAVLVSGGARVSRVVAVSFLAAIVWMATAATLLCFWPDRSTIGAARE